MAGRADAARGDCADIGERRLDTSSDGSAGGHLRNLLGVNRKTSARVELCRIRPIATANECSRAPRRPSFFFAPPSKNRSARYVILF